MDVIAFFGTIEEKKYRFGYKDSDIAKAIKISPRTYANRKQKPRDFSILEIESIMKFLKFTEEEKKEALFK